MPRVAIVISGGNFQGVYSDDPGVLYTVIDHDNLEEGDDPTDAAEFVQADLVSDMDAFVAGELEGYR